MSHDDNKLAKVGRALEKAGKQLAPSSFKAIAAFFGELLGRPDLEEAATSALQEDVVRLYERIEVAVSGLSQDVSSKIDPIEAVDLTTQTVLNMGVTAQRERREMMAQVLVHGLAQPHDDGLHKRLFVRAVADLDVAHVDLLRRIEKRYGWKARTGTEHALLNELVQRGFVGQDDEERPRTMLDESRAEPRIVTRTHVTGLGKQFLSYLKTPDDAKGVKAPDDDASVGDEA